MWCGLRIYLGFSTSLAPTPATDPATCLSKSAEIVIWEERAFKCVLFLCVQLTPYEKCKGWDDVRLDIIIIIISSFDIETSMFYLRICWFFQLQRLRFFMKLLGNSGEWERRKNEGGSWSAQYVFVKVITSHHWLSLALSTHGHDSLLGESNNEHVWP